MKKFLVIAAASLASAFMVAQTAHAAATVSNAFDVKASLNSQCTAVASGTQTLDFGTYTALAAAPAAPTSLNIDFNCTRGHIPASVAFDTGVAGGVLVGLHYDLTVSAGAIQTAGTAAGAGVGATGSADLRRYSVGGSMPDFQAGACVGTSCGPTTATRTLILTF